MPSDPISQNLKHQVLPKYGFNAGKYLQILSLQIKSKYSCVQSNLQNTKNILFLWIDQNRSKHHSWIYHLIIMENSTDSWAGN